MSHDAITAITLENGGGNGVSGEVARFLDYAARRKKHRGPGAAAKTAARPKRRRQGMKRNRQQLSEEEVQAVKDFFQENPDADPRDYGREHNIHGNTIRVILKEAARRDGVGQQLPADDNHEPDDELTEEYIPYTERVYRQTLQKNVAVPRRQPPPMIATTGHLVFDLGGGWKIGHDLAGIGISQTEGLLDEAVKMLRSLATSDQVAIRLSMEFPWENDHEKANQNHPGNDPQPAPRDAGAARRSLPGR